MARSKSTVPANIDEEYYQISEEILSSFPKFRPPVDLFRFNEDALTLIPLIRKGQRLSNEQVDEVHSLCNSGNLFVSRSDHPIYSEHMVKQLDLVLQDSNLKEAEIADICSRALIMRHDSFAEQPVRPVFEPLYKDIMVFTEILWQDRHRIKLFMRRLLHDYSLSAHAFNTLIVGSWLLLRVMEGGELRRRDLDRAALAFFLQDIGMAKIPAFILNKAAALKPEELDKVVLHPTISYKIMQKLELAFEELSQASMEHHERMDGSGYPQKSKGQQISRIGRIAAIADSFAAMISKRPYAEAKDPAQAAQELAADQKRYDGQLTGYLLTAVMTGVVGEAHSADQAPKDNDHN
ncbi:MAG: HD domain-containing protein [Deltaproteobacteria bacterium]|jgi:response regulator RpfG family c-di-GMP phosphodiesterase|nr:HD domain-containing protein [Deltaproteobacteria bacterium]